MSPERMRHAARLLSELGNVTMARELVELSHRSQWNPISEIHEDYGDCVLMNLDDPGSLQIGSNLNLNFDELRWTHFSRIVPLSHADYETMAAARDGGEK